MQPTTTISPTKNSTFPIEWASDSDPIDFIDFQDFFERETTELELKELEENGPFAMSKEVTAFVEMQNELSNAQNRVEFLTKQLVQFEDKYNDLHNEMMRKRGEWFIHNDRMIKVMNDAKNMFEIERKKNETMTEMFSNFMIFETARHKEDLSYPRFMDMLIRMNEMNRRTAEERRNIIKKRALTIPTIQPNTF